MIKLFSLGIVVTILTGCVQTVSVETLHDLLSKCKNNNGIENVKVDSRNVEDGVFFDMKCKDGYTLRYPNRMDN